MEDKKILGLESVALDDTNNTLVLLDQTLLPNEVKLLHLTTVEEVWEAIYELRVRGAPAIGIAAAYGLYLAAKTSPANDFESLQSAFSIAKKYLASARPTAVNLFWALDRMDACLQHNRHLTLTDLKNALRQEADDIKAEDTRVNRAIGEHALTLLQPGAGILTHCNAGQLATSRYGTATSPMYLGQERGYNFKVFADETRPLLQGARLTTLELSAAGVDVTLICDNMAATVMKNGWIQAVLVGCDRVAANGDTANKIGTAGVAILAHNFGIPFYVCAPSSTIDLNCATGDDIHIELRKPEEVSEKWYAQPMAPKGINIYNPAFDVTDNRFITAIITEFGIIRPDYQHTLKEALAGRSRND
jgi:methylthioribose-1-phosphate isomerase